MFNCLSVDEDRFARIWNLDQFSAEEGKNLPLDGIINLIANIPG